MNKVLNNYAWMRTSSLNMIRYPHATTKEVEMSALSNALSYDPLQDSMHKCFKGVLWKDPVAHFYINESGELNKLTEELSNDKYKQRRVVYFRVGKRDIMSIAFRDRVVQRSLNDNILYPAIAPTLIRNNCACQVGKGTKDGRERMIKMIRREWRLYGTDLYCLKCDIKSYYGSLPHSVGIAELERVLPDDVMSFLRDHVLNVYDGDVGYIAGNQTVQIIGISALSPLDHFIKEKLRVKSYVRYMDDFILISHDKEYLEYCLREIKKRLNSYGLQLNERKTKLFSLKEQNIEFLGFDFHLAENGKVCVYVASNKIKRKRVELARMASKVKRGEKDRESADQAYRDWRKHAEYGDTYNFLKRMDTFYYGLYKEDSNEDTSKFTT